MQSLKEHVAGLRYQPHLNDKLKFLKVNNIEELEKKKEDKKKLVEKVGSYAKYVKEMYWP